MKIPGFDYDPKSGKYFASSKQQQNTKAKQMERRDSEIKMQTKVKKTHLPWTMPSFNDVEFVKQIEMELYGRATCLNVACTERFVEGTYLDESNASLLFYSHSKQAILVNPLKVPLFLFQFILQ